MPNIRLHVMGSKVDINSPVNITEFLQGMVNLVNTRSADPQWTGYHQFETINQEIVYVRVRAIDIVEAIPELTALPVVEEEKPKPKAKRKTATKPKPKAKRKTTPKKKVEPVEDSSDDIYK